MERATSPPFGKWGGLPARRSGVDRSGYDFSHSGGWRARCPPHVKAKQPHYPLSACDWIHDPTRYDERMTTAIHLGTPDFISVADYLAGEADSPVRHEYLGGVVYAMAGASNRHNLVATNFAGICTPPSAASPAGSTTATPRSASIRATSTRFYYPDGLVVCKPNPPEDSFQDQPVVVAEVLSDATRRTDESEKRDAYLTLPTLKGCSLSIHDPANVPAG